MTQQCIAFSHDFIFYTHYSYIDGKSAFGNFCYYYEMKTGWTIIQGEYDFIETEEDLEQNM